MKAEGPKERTTAVPCYQLSARYVQMRQTTKIRNTYGLVDITSLRFDVCTYMATLRTSATTIALYCTSSSTPSIPAPPTIFVHGVFTAQLIT